MWEGFTMATLLNSWTLYNKYPDFGPKSALRVPPTIPLPDKGEGGKSIF